MTLIPVSKISVEVDNSSKVGAFLWIGSRCASSAKGSSKSMVSPSTLKTRPNVSFPTGTEIGRPVSRTSIPRVKPSVDSMAMVRTIPCPSSKATSSTTFCFDWSFL